MNVSANKLAKLDEIEYPVITWEDNDDSSAIHVYNSATNSRELHEHEKRSLSDLLVFYGNYFANKDIQELALAGDRFTYPFRQVFSDNFDLSYFEDQLQEFLAAFSADPTLSVKLREELKQFFQNDLAASLTEAIFESIAEKIVRYSLELKSATIVSIGNLNFNERFRSVLQESAGEFGLDVRFIDDW